MLPPFTSVKFGLELAVAFLTIVVALLLCYWKVTEHLLNRQLRRRNT